MLASREMVPHSWKGLAGMSTEDVKQRNHLVIPFDKGEFLGSWGGTFLWSNVPGDVRLAYSLSERDRERKLQNELDLARIDSMEYQLPEIRWWEFWK